VHQAISGALNEVESSVAYMRGTARLSIDLESAGRLAWRSMTKSSLIVTRRAEFNRTKMSLLCICVYIPRHGKNLFPTTKADHRHGQNHHRPLEAVALHLLLQTLLAATMAACSLLPSSPAAGAFTSNNTAAVRGTGPVPAKPGDGVAPAPATPTAA
jgi:hypothetical protein